MPFINSQNKSDLPVSQRDFDSITAEIKSLSNKVKISYIEIGNLLIEAKKIVGKHGVWLDWLQNNTEFSESMARKMMSVARTFTNRSPCNNLEFSKMYLLSTLPDDELEDFIEKTHDVCGVETKISDMSKRQLEEVIRNHKRRNKLKKSSPLMSKSKKLSIICEEPNIIGQERSVDLEYLRSCIDGIINQLEKLTDSPAKYDELSLSLSILCEETLTRISVKRNHKNNMQKLSLTSIHQRVRQFLKF